MPAFPTTRWSRILAQQAPRDLEALARDYHRPIQAFLAARFRLRDDDAADLSQEAFAWMLATRLFDRADPGRGRFRGLLKTALSNFAIEHLRKAAAEKRGGRATHEPIDAAGETADPRSRTPDQVLDEAWRRELLQRARDRLQTELEQNGRDRYFLLFRDWFLDERGDLDHTALAARHGITRTDVSNWLDHAKRRYREILRAEVMDTVTDPHELEEELQWLFAAAPRRQEST